MVAQNPPPAIRIPPPPSIGSSLPDLPEELLISAFLGRGERDALDTFVQGGGGVQVEDVLNELIPDGELSRTSHTLPPG